MVFERSALETPCTRPREYSTNSYRDLFRSLDHYEYISTARRHHPTKTHLRLGRHRKLIDDVGALRNLQRRVVLGATKHRHSGCLSHKPIRLLSEQISIKVPPNKHRVLQESLQKSKLNLLREVRTCSRTLLTGLE